MTAFRAGILIWIKTLVIGGIFIGIGGIWFGSWYAPFIGMMVTVVGAIITLPLLVIIIPLVKWSAEIPYSTGARMAWLTFYLTILIALFYAFFESFFDGKVSNEYALFVGGTIAALFIAVATTRKSLRKLMEQHDEAAGIKNTDLNILNRLQ